jgi:hypothetical protein
METILFFFFLLSSSSSSLTRHGGLRNLQTMKAQMGQKDDGL